MLFRGGGAKIGYGLLIIMTEEASPRATNNHIYDFPEGEPPTYGLHYHYYYYFFW